MSEHHMEYVSIKVISSGFGTEFWIVLSLRPRCGRLVLWGKLKLIHQVRPGILLRNGFSSNTSELIGILSSFKSLSWRFILPYSCISEESTILMSSLQLSGSLEQTWWCHISPTDRSFCQDLGIEVACQLHSQLQNGEEMELLVALTSLLWSPVCFLSPGWVALLAHRTSPASRGGVIWDGRRRVWNKW